MKLSKRILACVMTLIMLVGCVQPLGVMAAEEPIAVANDSYVGSGNCGENLTWTLDGEGTLTISGNGAMEELSRPNPWEEYAWQINALVIEPGVTTICNYAFDYLDNLSRVSLPDGLLSIGYDAFSYCSSLTEITIPDSVTSIGCYAFSGCWNLTSVKLPSGLEIIEHHTFAYCDSLAEIVIPEGVREIGWYAFLYCENLKSISIPSSVYYIASDAFKGCEAVENIQVAEDNWEYYTDAQGVLYNGTELMKAPVKLSGNYTVADSVYTICEGAFANCTKLTGIALPDKVENICYGAFKNCTSLKSIFIPSSVWYVDGNAFNGCTSLEKIQVDEANGEYTSDDQGVLYSWDQSDLIVAPAGLSGSYTVPEGVYTIDSGVFTNCTKLKSISIPSTVFWIDSKAFDGCTSLEKIRVDEDNWDYSSDASGVLHNWDGTSIIKAPAKLSGSYTVSEGVYTIDSYAFANCSSLTGVKFSESVQYIGGNAFNNSALKSVRIPGNITSVAYNAFANCSQLQRVTLEEGVQEIEDAFGGCEKLNTVVIPESVEYISEGAFNGCSNLTDIYFTGSESQWAELDFNYTDAQVQFNVDPSELVTVGDLDGDDVVSDTDAMYLLRHTLFPTRYPISQSGDVNNDGALNDQDAMYLLRHTLFPDRFPLYPTAE